MDFSSFFRPCCINIDPYSSVSRSNSDFCICKFKLIAFLGNYSMYCIRPDPLRASKRVWLRETRSSSTFKRVCTCNTFAYQRVTNARNIAKAASAMGLPRIVKYTSIQSIWGVVAALIG